MRKHLASLLMLGGIFIYLTPTISQLNIVNVNVNEFNISPASLSQITVSNSFEQGQVRIEGKLTNSANEILISTISNPVILKTGVNVFGSHNLTFSQFIYLDNPQGQYIRNMHRLPSGSFNYCVQIIPLTNIEEGDEYCQSIDASLDEQLFLVNPYDEEVINTSTPILIWSHTEPFNILGPGEFFRMKLTEILENQAPEEAILVNTPVFIKNYLEKHQVQYPFDAENLVNGKRYAWQVEKMSNNNIIASTEVWEFSLEKKSGLEGVMYVELKKKLDGSVYLPVDDRIFFRYDERYQNKSLNCRILSDSRVEIKPEIENEQSGNENTLSTGYNSYALDLKPYKLDKGYYTLEVKNRKGELYLLKFYVE